jgi:hypothetical protein
MLEPVDEELARRAERHADLLAYDFFKSLTGLSVVTLGGILSLAGSVYADAVEKEDLLLTAIFISLGGVMALWAQIELVAAARKRRQPRRIVEWCRLLVPGLFGASVGTFLASLEGVLF